MNIIGLDYTIGQQSIDIYVAGCRGPHCNGCHNTQSHDFCGGKPYTPGVFASIKKKIAANPGMIKNIMIFGGEPLDQDEGELIELLDDMSTFSLTMWVFTRYDIDHIPNEIKDRVDFIKSGRYIPELKCDDNVQYGIKLSTWNQRIYKKGLDY